MARLSWERKEVEVPGSTGEVRYSVLVSSEGAKQDSKEVYRSGQWTGQSLIVAALLRCFLSLCSGTDNCCTVGGDVLTFGHTHHFTVSASVGDISGDPSQSESLSPSHCLPPPSIHPPFPSPPLPPSPHFTIFSSQRPVWLSLLALRQSPSPLEPPAGPKAP